MLSTGIDRCGEVARLVQETSQIDSHKRLDDTLEDKKDGRDVESIEVTSEPEMKAISALVGDAMLESQEHEGMNGRLRKRTLMVKRWEL